MKSDSHPTAAPGLGTGDAVLALDVGGTDVKAALVDPSGVIRSIVRRPTPHRGRHTAEAVLAEAEAILTDFATEHPGTKPKAVGLVIPGLVDDIRGIGIHAENLDWRDFPFREYGERVLGLPVAVGHDVRAAGQAEFELGAARGYRDVVVMTIGTGIAAAIFADGRPYLAGGFAGEIGHAVVDPAGPLCACGGHGCLEAIASAGAIARAYRARTGERIHGAKEVLARAMAGDDVALTIWNGALDALAAGLAHTVAILAPEAVVIGGGLAQAGAALFAPVERRLDALLTFQRRPILLPARIGQNAGLIGAALRARELIAGLPGES